MDDMNAIKPVPAKFYHSKRYRETILPPADDRIKESIVWRLSFVDEWRERRLLLCKKQIFIGIDEMKLIIEVINLVTFIHDVTCSYHNRMIRQS